MILPEREKAVRALKVIRATCRQGGPCWQGVAHALAVLEHPLIALAPEMVQGLRAIVQVLDGSQPTDPKGALLVAQTLLARVDA